jgi:hypothetical protein
MSANDTPSYDELREKNIARNNKVLEEMGFSASRNPIASPDASSSKKKSASSKRWTEHVVVGTRSSKRLKADPAEDVSVGDGGDVQHARAKAPAVTRANNLEIYSHPALKAFDKESIVKRRSSLTWDTKKMYNKHLELSSCRREVATTGCAGYGAALACADGAAVISEKKSGGKAATWSVEMLEEGKGGFSVGVCLANTNAPFKSMGKRPDSWVLHNSGLLLHNHGESNWLENGYSVGDVIEIKLSAIGELSYTINDALVQTTVIVPPGKYVLCCQPYMGGACRLL